MPEISEEGGKKQNRGIIPLYSDESEPKINDPALVQAGTVWRGSNEITLKLLRCLEPMRDLATNMETLAKGDNPNANQRLVKQLSSPLYTMGSGILDMLRELESNGKKYTLLGSTQHKEIINRKKQFEVDFLDNESNLRVVRDKIDSHIDKLAVIKPEDYWSKVNLCSFLELMRNYLEQIVYLLSLNAYGWTRESGHPELWSLMSVDGTLVDLYMQNGEPQSIINVTLVKSPKYGVFNEIKAFVALFNEVAQKCLGVELIEILENDQTELEQ